MTGLVVLGDALLDREIDGTTDRLCPDAPAPVLTERHTIDRPGGAGLAATLAAADGHRVTLVTPVAHDPAAERLTALLSGAGVALCPVSLPATAATSEKIRMWADGQVLLRLDRGAAAPEPVPPPAQALSALRDADAVLVSDYGRGLTRLPAVREALASTPAPVVWDPHPAGAPAVPGTRLVTPNARELATLTGTVPAGPTRQLDPVARGAQELRRQWRAGAAAVTLGPQGALLCHAGQTPLVVPVPEYADGDSCGAGDRFAAAAAAALGQGALVSEAVQAAVAAATAYVRQGAPSGAAEPPAGVGARVPGTTGPAAAAAEQVARVRARGGTVVATGGCFDLLHAGHVATLEAARGLGDCLVVCLNSDTSVAALKGPDRPLVPETDRVRLLQALGCVDAVVLFDEPTPQAVLTWLRPDLWVKGGDYADGTRDGSDLPEAEVVRRWGGQAVVVPYIDGRSSSELIAAARGGSPVNQKGV